MRSGPYTPRLSLQLWAQPFLATGDYGRFKELSQPRTRDWDVYGEAAGTIAEADGAYTVDPDGSGPAQPFSFGTPDFNVRSLRGNAVLRWAYRPGSTSSRGCGTLGGGRRRRRWPVTAHHVGVDLRHHGLGGKGHPLGEVPGARSPFSSPGRIAPRLIR